MRGKRAKQIRKVAKVVQVQLLAKSGEMIPLRHIYQQLKKEFKRARQSTSVRHRDLPSQQG